jgi:raffinose/stachyose/melibiose transport system permease protein
MVVGNASSFGRRRLPSGGRRRSESLGPWRFVLPLIAFQVVVVLGPAIMAVYYSFTDWDGFSSAPFVGLDNYRQLIADPDFQQAFTHNAFYILLMPIPFLLALTAASLLMRVGGRAGMVYRLAFFIPFMLPSVVNSFVWKLLLDPTQGLQSILPAIGVPNPGLSFLGDTSTSLATVWFVDEWHFWPFLVVVLFAAMQSIPPDLYEAARVEGASWWQEFRFVTVPSITSTLAFMFIIACIWCFLVFDYPWVLTYGGPAGSSETIGTLVVKTGILAGRGGYGAAMGLMMTLFAAIPVGIFVYLRRRGAEI